MKINLLIRGEYFGVISSEHILWENEEEEIIQKSKYICKVVKKDYNISYLKNWRLQIAIRS